MTGLIRTCLLLIVFVPLLAKAELTIVIDKGTDNPTPIAVVPFAVQGGARLPEDVASIVRADLQRSGQFDAMAPRDMLAFPSTEREIYYRDWRMLGSEYLVIGKLSAVTGGWELNFELYDVVGQRRVLPLQSVSGTAAQLRDMAHFAADKIYQAITGIRGAFSTKIVYVEALLSELPGQSQYRLMLADADGAREKVLLTSKQPLLSPSWSPDGKRVAYVSFETSRPAVFVQEIATAKREQVTNFKGLNGAPAWSPDGTKLAVVLSKDGNPEIYVLDLATKQLTRVTRHFAIDTEPNWTADGKGIIFTSNRGGQPQIYQVTLASGRVERLTFEGNYNARGRISPDGKTLVMVHRETDVFQIATQDLKTGNMRLLTETQLDESPSIAPNGAMLIYATKAGNKGILAAVSMDAGVKFRLPSKRGDVREPAWSPYFD